MAAEEHLLNLLADPQVLIREFAANQLGSPLSVDPELIPWLCNALIELDSCSTVLGPRKFDLGERPHLLDALGWR